MLRPAGHADTYDVSLFGVGDGDLIVTFRWTTPRDGPLPEPDARRSVLSDHNGAVDSYGVELELTNLARTPRKASATITVRAETGEAVTFEATRSKSRCLPQGTVYWDGPDDRGLSAALGDGPSTYEVELVLGGARYIATATWPADEIAGNEPSVPSVSPRAFQRPRRHPPRSLGERASFGTPRLRGCSATKPCSRQEWVTGLIDAVLSVGPGG